MTMSYELWRKKSVLSKKVSLNLCDNLLPFIFPSARQCLTQALSILRLTRTSCVAIKKFSGHCVINALGKVATPVPYKFIKNSKPDAILIHDQWGWEKPLRSIIRIRKKNPHIPIIWDRVDSLFLCNSEKMGFENDFVNIHIFSLSKILGIGGGGLMWQHSKGWIKPHSFIHDGIVQKLHKFESSVKMDKHLTMILDKIYREELYALPPTTALWLEENDIGGAMVKEYEERHLRLKLAVNFLGCADQFPKWMSIIIDDNFRGAMPVIFPLFVSRVDIKKLIKELKNKFNLNTEIYHFDFSDDYFSEKKYERVLPIPLHGEVPMDSFEKILQLIKWSMT